RPRLWAIALGEGGRHFEDCRNAGIIGIGWAYLGDLRQYPTREAIAAAIQQRRRGDANPTNSSLCNWQFLHDIAIGDLVVAHVGQWRLVGAGIVESDYQYDSSHPLPSQRRVRWVSSDGYDLSKRARVPTKTLTDVSAYRALRTIVAEVYPQLQSETVAQA